MRCLFCVLCCVGLPTLLIKWYQRKRSFTYGIGFIKKDSLDSKMQYEEWHDRKAYRRLVQRPSLGGLSQGLNLGVAGISTLQNSWDSLLNSRHFGLITQPRQRQPTTVRMIADVSLWSITDNSALAFVFCNIWS